MTTCASVRSFVRSAVNRRRRRACRRIATAPQCSEALKKLVGNPPAGGLIRARHFWESAGMWGRKGDRDREWNAASPIPTQVVSNEEFLPRPQTEKQKQVEDLTMEMGTANAKKLGMTRRAYMASSLGIATALIAQNKVFGQV